MGVKASRTSKSHSYHEPIQPLSHVLQHLTLSTGLNGRKKNDTGCLGREGHEKRGRSNDEAKGTKGECHPLHSFLQGQLCPLNPSVEKHGDCTDLYLFLTGPVSM